MSNISNALWITALGMGLVFGAIMLLWLMMVVLTLFTADKESASESAPEPPPLTPQPSSDGIPTGVLREAENAWAAAVAVAMALAEQENSAAHPLSTPPTAIVSAWQLGMRTRLLAQKGNTRRR